MFSDMLIRVSNFYSAIVAYEVAYENVSKLPIMRELDEDDGRSQTAVLLELG